MHPDNTVTVFHGKTDLGQGLETTFRQIVAEEMDLAFKQVKSIVGDTAQSPHQGGASGSTGVTGGGPPVRNIAAEARRVLVEAAAVKLGVPVSQLRVIEGVVSSATGAKVTYGELLGGKLFNTTVQSNMSFGNGLTAQGVARPKNPADHHIVGSSVPRIDIPDKVFGKYNFNVDAKLPGMVHARVDPSVRRRLDGRQDQRLQAEDAWARPGDADGRVLRRRRRRARGAGDRCRAGTRRHVVEARNGPVHDHAPGSSTGSAPRSRGTAPRRRTRATSTRRSRARRRPSRPSTCGRSSRMRAWRRATGSRATTRRTR